ncbi:hypothetical protein WJ47_08065 [Burkholderia ubonensis]|uniref:AAA+ ATPase domain-containing protein n=1 Tax=Burkholderia ubonensis TaxID=101571 RepID=A0AB73G2I3_9BURK|nr:AAA family ATPase [Burkholderia ubonensis]KVK86852.1 hypothetical protein WJ44_34850 [Burkholderia ubonensis]KVL70280.1 hypothetical protein WJ47_08065 [Burkholderia ubonensis]KVM27954.1 hypothetical protein WJ53_10535 [Burkholderia ubonensis]KVM28094.1 hypothetical protein WJ54_13590 [Burkholderia ubonensis]
MGADIRSTTRTDVLYPRELEEAAAPVKLAFFRNSIVAHPLFDAKLAELRSMIDSGLRGTMLVLVGPAGVGKSALGEVLCQMINREYFDAFPDDSHRIPAAWVEAWAAERDRFDWLDFYESILGALQIPLIGESVPEVKRMVAGREVVVPVFDRHPRPSLRILRQRLRRAMVMRSPALIFVDEASNILLSSQHEHVKRHANTLRSIVNRVDTRLLLTGAYELYELVTQSGQLARRGEVIHFRPYQRDEAEQFMHGLIALQNCIPFNEGCSLGRFAEMLFDQSLGCIGHLKRILVKAMSIAMAEGKRIDHPVLLHSCYPPSTLERLRQEIYSGYRRVEGAPHPEDRGHTEPAPAASEAAIDDSPETSKTITHRNRIGRTRPSRGWFSN